MNQVMEHERIGWIDTAKGIGMLLVIMGHMGISRNSILHYAIFSVHMPLFFLISGYFLNPAIGEKTFLKRKGFSLLIPYLFTSCCLIMLAQLQNAVKIILHRGTVVNGLTLFFNWVIAAVLGSGSRKDFLFFHPKMAIGAIWFLLALFFAEAIVYFTARKISHNIYIYISDSDSWDCFCKAFLDDS